MARLAYKKSEPTARGRGLWFPGDRKVSFNRLVFALFMAVADYLHSAKSLQLFYPGNLQGPVRVTNIPDFDLRVLKKFPENLQYGEFLFGVIFKADDFSGRL